MNVRLKHAYSFESVKCVRPIACDRSGIVHDLLVQLTLDPEVRVIDLLDRVERDGGSLQVGAITIQTAKEGFLLDFDATRIARSADEHRLVSRAVAEAGFFPVEVTAKQIMMEPRFGAARAVWSHRRIAVPASMRLALIKELDESGPLPLHEICLRVPGPIDPVGAICALACAGELEFDLREGLLPATIVRSRA